VAVRGPRQNRGTKAKLSSPKKQGQNLEVTGSEVGLSEAILVGPGSRANQKLSTWTYNRLSGRVVLNQAVLLVNWLELLRILLAGSGEEGQDISCLLLPRTRGDQVLIDFLRVIVCRTCGPLLGP
jgi:hypothetical protein